MDRPAGLLKYDNKALVTRKNEIKSPEVPTLRATINAFFPPRKWMENNQLWVQQVSTAPSSHRDVMHLQEKLDLLLHRQASKFTATELYSECLDELIRQVTINCAERGALLLEVRDEMLMTISAYDNLSQSGYAFGVRKVLQAAVDTAVMDKRITDLENEKLDLVDQLNEQTAKCAAIKKMEAESWQALLKEHTEEIQPLKRSYQHLKAQLLEFVPK